MRLQYTSQHGRFDLLSTDESWMCHIRIYDDEGKQIKAVSVAVDGDERGWCVEDAVDLICQDFERLWIDTRRDDKAEFLRFILDNADEIERGSAAHEVERIDAEIERLQDRRRSAQRTAEHTEDLAECIYLPDKAMAALAAALSTKETENDG